MNFKCNQFTLCSTYHYNINSNNSIINNSIISSIINIIVVINNHLRTNFSMRLTSISFDILIIDIDFSDSICSCVLQVGFPAMYNWKEQQQAQHWVESDLENNMLSINLKILKSFPKKHNEYKHLNYIFCVHK